MPNAKTDDGVNLYYEETGTGDPILFIHEYAGDCRSWEPQVRYFANRYRCITYNARGYPPSEVPANAADYSQARAVADAIAVLDHLRIERAHVVGFSMGGFCSLHVGLRHPERARSQVIAGCGYGARADKRDQFKQECETAATAWERDGAEVFAERYAQGPSRVQLQNKNPRAWAEFSAQLGEHSARGMALTMRGVQMQRPSLYDLQDGMTALDVPALVMTGDEDEPCLEPALYLKRNIPTAGLVVLPKCGHGINLEEPQAFNHWVQDFFATVEHGRWGARDPRASLTGILGVKS